jgi:hypothetical protein
MYAVVSDFALRNASACAFPRPSAIASAKFANSTVNHSQSVICRLNAKWVEPCGRISNSVVTTLPTSTTNITGFFACSLGFSFFSESTAARRTMDDSNIARFFEVPVCVALISSNLEIHFRCKLTDLLTR